MKKTLLTTLSIALLLTSSCSLKFGKTKSVKSDAKKQTAQIDAKEKSRRAELKKVPACKKVLKECKKLDFVEGGFSEGNGLWRNCFYPTIEGKAATSKGKEVKVAANAKDVAACKPSVSKK